MSKRATVVAAATCSMLLLGGGAAFAQSSTQSTTVSCDVTITSNLVTLYQSKSGPMSIKQISSSPSINSYYWATSSNGNSVGAKSAVNGGTVSWNPVAPSNYTFKTHVVSSTNCNGAYPGDGNASLSFTATTS